MYKLIYKFIYKNICKLILTICGLGIIPGLALADGGVGDVANNLMDPLTFMGDFLQAGCFIVGGGFIFASVVKFFDHRRSPTMVPLSTVVLLFIAGLVLVALPFLSYVLPYAVPFTLLKNN
jgi:hypothetical protein